MDHICSGPAKSVLQKPSNALPERFSEPCNPAKQFEMTNYVDHTGSGYHRRRAGPSGQDDWDYQGHLDAEVLLRARFSSPTLIRSRQWPMRCGKHCKVIINLASFDLI